MRQNVTFLCGLSPRLEKDGKRDGTLKIWGNALNNLDKTGLAPLRFGFAKQLVGIRSDLRELKDKYGIETGKILARFTENMTRADLQAGLEGWAMEWTNTMDLTDEDKQAAARIQFSHYNASCTFPKRNLWFRRNR